MILETLISIFCLVNTHETPPIGEGISIRIGAVQDGVDSRGEGFAALLDHVSSWSTPSTSPPHADFLFIQEHPDRVRGQRFEISGVVEQIGGLSSPWNEVSELFVRASSGQLFGIYVKHSQGIRKAPQIVAPALFYKNITLEGRDQQIRSYPTFVTSNQVIITSAFQQVMPNTYVVIAICGVVVFVFYLVFRISRKKKPLRSRLTIQSDEVVLAASASTGELPENPAEALAIMYEDSEDIA